MRRLLIISLLVFTLGLCFAQENYTVSGYCTRTDTYEIMVGGWGPGFNPSPGWITWGFDGVYSITLQAGYNGVAIPTSSIPGTFSPASRTYTNLSADLMNECYAFSPVTNTISGRITRTDTGAGLGGVVLSGADGYFETDTNGFYTISVLPGWSGTITPQSAQTGFFTPAFITYNNVTYNQTGQNYTWTPTTVTIQGTVTHNLTGQPIQGVTLYDLTGNPQTDAAGHYTASVQSGFSGMVTPSYSVMGPFAPPNRVYYNVTENQSGQDYTWQPITYSITGRVFRADNSEGISGVWFTGFPDSVVTNTGGFYTAHVPRGFSGLVYPQYSSYDSFNPFSEFFTTQPATIPTRITSGPPPVTRTPLLRPSP
jgi:hypothetical protein